MTPENVKLILFRASRRLKDHATLDDVLSFCEECARVGAPEAGPIFFEESQPVSAGKVAARMLALTEELRTRPARQPGIDGAREHFSAALSVARRLRP